MIYRGANVSDDISADLTLPIWAQLHADVEALKQGGTSGGHGGASVTYDKTTGELIITGRGVTYNENTGALLI